MEITLPPADHAKVVTKQALNFNRNNQIAAEVLRFVRLVVLQSGRGYFSASEIVLSRYVPDIRAHFIDKGYKVKAEDQDRVTLLTISWGEE